MLIGRGHYAIAAHHCVVSEPLELGRVDLEKIADLLRGSAARTGNPQRTEKCTSLHTEKPATTYSPTAVKLQYHRRKRA